MLLGVGARAAAPRPGVIGREHTAHEGDDRQAELPVVAEGVDIPPEITTRRDNLVKPRSAISVAAAKRPDMAAMGTPGPGCTLPPARNSPGTGLAAGDLANAEFQPWVAWPYSAPPVPGKSR